MPLPSRHAIERVAFWTSLTSGPIEQQRPAFLGAAILPRPPEAENAAGATGHGAWRVRPRVWRAVPPSGASSGDKNQNVLVSRRDRSLRAKDSTRRLSANLLIN